ncbi:MAG TPA: DUF4142 domain-containing protein [Caulobacteraceae bacterium]|nr:DUF4142 domain-containing protein [Caulobacteraceae bacterium]
MKRFVCAAAVAALGLAAAPALGQSVDDNSFIQKAVGIDTAEIHMGHMLEQKGGSAQVRRYGAVLVQDHTTSRRQAEAIAHAMKVTAPEEAPPDVAQQMSQLQGLSGAAFDRQAKQDAVQDHQQAIAMFEQEAHDGHAQAAQHARQTLPVLRKHLRMAQALNG